MSHFPERLVLSMVLSSLAPCACGPMGPGGPGPLTANPAITNTLANPRSFQPGASVECMGPSSETALLGPLCGLNAIDANWRVGLADFDLVIRQPGGGPAVLLFGFVPNAMSTSNQAMQVRYAAFVDLAPSPAPAADWPTSEAMSGTVTTLFAQRVACNQGTFTAWGEFRWRNTTVRVTWSASQPC